MLEEALIGGTIGLLGSIYIGVNFVGIPDSMSRFIGKRDEAREYENKLREKRNSISGALNYYFGYAGRQIAHRSLKSYL